MIYNVSGTSQTRLSARVSVERQRRIYTLAQRRHIVTPGIQGLIMDCRGCVMGLHCCVSLCALLLCESVVPWIVRGR
jgi:hypothetical protein